MLCSIQLQLLQRLLDPAALQVQQPSQALCMALDIRLVLEYTVQDFITMHGLFEGAHTIKSGRELPRELFQGAIFSRALSDQGNTLYSK